MAVRVGPLWQSWLQVRVLLILQQLLLLPLLLLPLLLLLLLLLYRMSIPVCCLLHLSCLCRLKRRNLRVHACMP